MHNIKPTQKGELHTVVGFCTDYIKQYTSASIQKNLYGEKGLKGWGVLDVQTLEPEFKSPAGMSW